MAGAILTPYGQCHPDPLWPVPSDLDIVLFFPLFSSMLIDTPEFCLNHVHKVLFFIIDRHTDTFCLWKIQVTLNVPLEEGGDIITTAGVNDQLKGHVLKILL